MLAPGWDFILGMQDPNFARNAFYNGWLSKDSLLNEPFMMSHTEKLNLQGFLRTVQRVQDRSDRRPHYRQEHERILYRRPERKPSPGK